MGLRAIAGERVAVVVVLLLGAASWRLMRGIR